MAERAPGVEAAGEGALLITFADQAQATWPLMFFRPYVLDVYLASFQTQFDLHLACLCPNPHVDFLAIVQQHDVIVCEVILAKVRAFLSHCKVTLLIGAPEEPCVLHVLRIIVIGFLCTNAYPEEVLWLLTFIDDL